jgi:hypothetical protein
LVDGVDFVDFVDFVDAVGRRADAVAGMVMGLGAAGDAGGHFAVLAYAQRGVHLTAGFGGGLNFGLPGRGFLDLLLNVTVECLGAVANDLAVEMGGVLAHLDFPQNAGRDGGARAATHFVEPFGNFHEGHEPGAQGGAEAAFLRFLVFGAHALAFEFPALGFHFEAGGVLFAAEDFGDGVAEVAQGADLDEGLVVQFGGLSGQDGVAPEGDGGGEEFGGGLARGEFLEVFAAGGELGGLGGDVLAEEPFLVAALTPFGEVLFVDGVIAEVVGEDLADCREGVEPG